jgi:hypothetical protein
MKRVLHLPNDTLSIALKTLFAYPKRERYCFNRFCFENGAPDHTIKNGQPELARYFKTEPLISIVFFSNFDETIQPFFVLQLSSLLPTSAATV